MITDTAFKIPIRRGKVQLGIQDNINDDYYIDS